MPEDNISSKVCFTVVTNKFWYKTCIILATKKINCIVKYSLQYGNSTSLAPNTYIILSRAKTSKRVIIAPKIAPLIMVSN